MACIACFIDDIHQKQIKKQCFGIERFEDKLAKYKSLYLIELGNLGSVGNCTCRYKNADNQYVKWTDDFLHNMQSNTGQITNAFDTLREIYLSYIAHNNKIAIEKIWQYLQQNNLIYESESPFSSSNMLFRARENKSSLDSSDIRTFFHIPFNERGLIGNQRFSISGQPMLYYSYSALSLEKELSLPIEKLIISGFLPKYSIHYHRKFYEIKNALFAVIVKSLPGLIRSGTKLDYNYLGITPNKNSIIQDVQKSILSQVLTFPVEKKKFFVEEYVLPQLLTTALLENDYNGILFPSTKDFSELTNYHIFSEHEVNIAFFISYSPKDAYDNILLNSFHHFTFIGNESFKHTVSDINLRFESIVEKNKKSLDPGKNNDFIIPIVKTQLHIEYLENSKVNGIKYFDSKYGKIELEFFMKMADELDKYVK